MVIEKHVNGLTHLWFILLAAFTYKSFSFLTSLLLHFPKRVLESHNLSNKQKDRTKCPIDSTWTKEVLTPLTLKSTNRWTPWSSHVSVNGSVKIKWSWVIWQTLSSSYARLHLRVWSPDTVSSKAASLGWRVSTVQLSGEMKPATSSLIRGSRTSHYIGRKWIYQDGNIEVEVDGGRCLCKKVAMSLVISAWIHERTWLLVALIKVHHL